jgi:hypothetical protein
MKDFVVESEAYDSREAVEIAIKNLENKKIKEWHNEW